MGHSILYELKIQDDRCRWSTCPYCRKGFCILPADASVDEQLPCESELGEYDVNEVDTE